MTIYRQCSEAAKRLLEDPPNKHAGVFTEIDVVQLASTANWSEDDYKEALRHANQVVGTLYRTRKVCRYGPVILPDESQDYARIAAKIVYANAETGPDYWETPNGDFPMMMVQDDEIGRQGRRYNSNRTDSKSWEQQDTIRVGTQNGKPKASESELEQRVRKLTADLNAANRRAEELEQEKHQLRERKAQEYADLEDRVSELENATK